MKECPHFLQTILIFPRPLGTRSVALHSGQTKNLKSFLWVHCSFLIRNAENTRSLMRRYFAFSSLRRIRSLENIRKYVIASKTITIVEKIRPTLLLKIIESRIRTISAPRRKRFSSSFPLRPIINCIIFSLIDAHLHVSYVTVTI